MKKQSAGALPDIVARALDGVLSAGAVHGQGAAKLAVAYSGGLDSSALLHLARDYAAAHGLALFAFHIHHGLSANADAWLAHCRAVCEQGGVTFAARRVVLQEKARTGTEEAARKSRYAALGQLCREHGVPVLLTAHHQDDQAETVLLQLLRGSGTAGLSGMEAANAAPGLLGHGALVMARPLLSVSRRQLADHVAAHAIAHIDDESNDDPRFARNALRHQVMPALAQAFPGFEQRFARSAQHAQAAQRLLTELAQQDLAACLDGDCLDVARLRLLSTDRNVNLLRHWFGTRGIRMPSTAWLAEMLGQLFEARPDAQLLVSHPDCHVRRYRDRLYLTPHLAALSGMRDKDDEGLPELQKAGHGFGWRGEAALAFPAYGGTLHFDVVDTAAQGQDAFGIDAGWLARQALVIDFRKGGERLKLAANRPTKSLKYHYQAFDVPAWERERLPTVSAGSDLLFAAGIGMDSHHLGKEATPRIRLRWTADLAEPAIHSSR